MTRCGECDVHSGAHESDCSRYLARVVMVGGYATCGACLHAEGNAHAALCHYGTSKVTFSVNETKCNGGDHV